MAGTIGATNNNETGIEKAALQEGTELPEAVG